MTKSLKRRILEIPGEDGWKHKESALNVAGEMQQAGMCEDVIVQWIDAIYWEAASGFGA